MNKEFLYDIELMDGEEFREVPRTRGILYG